MPELAEVEQYRRRWDAGLGAPILAVRLHASKRVFRGVDVVALRRTLRGATLAASEARGKQMLFRIAPAGWLGFHLGMTGHLRVEDRDGHAGTSVRARSEQEVTLRPSSRAPQHDHLVLVQAERRLIFSDPRLFGRVRFDAGSEVPEWWRRLPPELLSDAFRRELVADFLRRRGRSPIKAVLLMQDRFPGIGNWMADEILFRAAIHPRRPAGTLQPAEIEVLWREIRTVARIALRSLSAGERDLPRHWLFHRRWDDGGTCPRTGVTLVRETIGGRTTCWSPGRQPSTALRSGRSVSRQRVRKRRTSS